MSSDANAATAATNNMILISVHPDSGCSDWTASDFNSRQEWFNWIGENSGADDAHEAASAALGNTAEDSEDDEVMSPDISDNCEADLVVDDPTLLTYHTQSNMTATPQTPQSARAERSDDKPAEDTAEDSDDDVAVGETIEDLATRQEKKYLL
jgi:hypothetical protein